MIKLLFFIQVLWLIAFIKGLERTESVVRSKRILGGTPGRVSEWPGIVSLRQRNLHRTLSWMGVPHGSSSGHFCGGFLVAPSWVLTTASCFPDRQVEQLLAQRNFDYSKYRRLIWLMRTLKRRKNLEDYDVCLPDDEDNSSSSCKIHRGVKNFIVHPGYILVNGPNKPGFDIALIHLDQPVSHLKPVALDFIPSTVRLPVSECKASGWGVSNTKEYENSDRFREMTVNLVSPKMCAPFIKHLELCGQTSTSQQSTKPDFCFFDTGGPLLCRDSLESGWRLTGLISRGTQPTCGAANNNGIYTAVAGYLDWMTHVMTTAS